jgi:hypothetical protein
LRQEVCVFAWLCSLLVAVRCRTSVRHSRFRTPDSACYPFISGCSYCCCQFAAALRGTALAFVQDAFTGVSRMVVYMLRLFRLCAWTVLQAAVRLRLFSATPAWHSPVLRAPADETAFASGETAARRASCAAAYCPFPGLVYVLPLPFSDGAT